MLMFLDFWAFVFVWIEELCLVFELFLLVFDLIGNSILLDSMKIVKL